MFDLLRGRVSTLSFRGWNPGNYCVWLPATKIIIALQKNHTQTLIWCFPLRHGGEGQGESKNSIMNKPHFLHTLQCKNDPKHPPFWELEFHLWNKYSQKKFIVGEEFTKLSKVQKENAVEINAEIVAEVSEKLSFSAVTVPGGYWELAPGKPAYYWLPEEFRMKQVKSLINTVGEDIAVIVNTGGVMAIPEAENYIDFSVMMFTDPEQVDKMAEEAYQNGINAINDFAEKGIEIFLTASDIADNSGPYFPPDQFDRFILPYLQKWSEYIEKNKMYSIMHTDGNIDLYLEQIANTPLNAIQALDPLSGMNILESKKNVGNKLCLCGNMDCGELITGTPESISQSTRLLLEDMSSYTGFSFGVSNVLETSTNKENFDALVKAYKSYIER
jgi:uroporphyrinogen decarboxylase